MSEEEYQTRDMVLTAYLMYLGYNLTRLDDAGGRGKTFVLNNTGGIEKAVEAFWNDDGSVEPKKYWECVKQIKTRLYEGVTQ